MVGSADQAKRGGGRAERGEEGRWDEGIRKEEEEEEDESVEWHLSCEVWGRRRDDEGGGGGGRGGAEVCGSRMGGEEKQVERRMGVEEKVGMGMEMGGGVGEEGGIGAVEGRFLELFRYRPVDMRARGEKWSELSRE